MNSRLILISVLVSLANAALLVAGYHLWNGHATPRIAMLDVAELYRLKESEFSGLLMKPGATDADRVRAIELARTFGTELAALTRSLPAECNCLILTKPAVVGGSIPDLTPDVKRRFGL